jgi:transcriptional antiterminator NusG
MSGKVEAIDVEKARATVLVEFLGYLTPTELDMVSLEKVEV